MESASDSSGNEMRNAHLDVYAVGMCTLCLVHCIALPLLTTLLPIAGVISDNGVVHRVLVLLAAPATIWLVYKASLERGSAGFIAMALSGLALLLIAAFVEALASFETPLTLVGATVLGFAHLQRWLRFRRYRRSVAQV